MEFAGPQLFFREPGFGNVTNEGTKHPIVAQSHGHYFQLNRELSAAAPDGHNFDTPPQYRALAGGKETAQAEFVSSAVLFRDDHVRHAPADGFRRTPAEDNLRLLVPTGDQSLRVHGDNRVERGLDD